MPSWCQVLLYATHENLATIVNYTIASIHNNNNNNNNKHNGSFLFSAIKFCIDIRFWRL